MTRLASVLAIIASVLAIIVVGCTHDPAAPPDSAPDAAAIVDRSSCVVVDESPEMLLEGLASTCAGPLGPLADAAREGTSLQPDVRALRLLQAARSAPGFRRECDVDDAIAARPLLEHPNLDACTKSAAFEPDPWMMDVRFYCAIDIGMFLFLDRVASRLPPQGLDDPKRIAADTDEDRSPLRSAFLRESRRRLFCDKKHPHYVERQKRIREQANKWNAVKGRARKEHRETWLVTE